jgi:hypothetical protein
MKQLFLLVLVLLFSLFCVNAKIEINNMEEYYAIGEEIAPTIQITYDMGVLASLSTEIICDEYSRVYFIQPLDLIEDNPVLIKVPPLKVYDKMLGTCIIDVYLDSILGAKLEKDWTKQFNISTEKRIKEDTIEMYINETGDIVIEEIIEEPEEKSSKAWIYALLLVIIILVASYFYIKHKITNQNDFNKGWKI